MMWFHLELKGRGCSAIVPVSLQAAADRSVHVCSRLLPQCEMSRDMTPFKADDGKACLIATSENNQTQHVSELTPDYPTPRAATPALSRVRHSRERPYSKRTEITSTLDRIPNQWSPLQRDYCQWTRMEHKNAERLFARDAIDYRISSPYCNLLGIVPI